MNPKTSDPKKKARNLPDLPSVKQEADEWYQKPSAVIGAVVIAGPLALPLVWMSKSLAQPVKIALTVALIIYAVVLVKVSADFYHALSANLDAGAQLLK